MNIAGLQKLTVSDFPGILACIIFTRGCNFRCPYCQNSTLIPVVKLFSEDLIKEETVFNFLEKRKKVLDGVVISGGEPLLQHDIKDFIIRVKQLGYKLKLDTNGVNYVLLKDLIDNNLLDYVAMDIKNDFSNYEKTAGVSNIEIENIKSSIELLKNSTIDYEFRTTIVKEFHNIENIKNMLKIIGHDSKYFLQNFEDSENVIDHTLHGFSDEELQKMKEELSEYDNLKIRGI